MILRKLRNKRFSLIMALVFAFTMIMPLTAFAADYNRLGSATSVDDNDVFPLNTVKAVFSAGELNVGDVVIIRLPEGFEFRDASNAVMDDADWAATPVDSAVYAYGDYSSGNYIATLTGPEEGFTAGDLSVSVLDDNEIKVKVESRPSLVEDSTMFIYLNKVYVDEGFDGDIELVMDAPGGSGFDDGSVVVGRVSGGAVNAEVIDDNSFSDSGKVTIRIEEDRAGGFDVDNESIKFVLPDGFEWDSDINGAWIGDNDAATDDSYEVKSIFGETFGGKYVATSNENGSRIVVDGDELSVDIGTKSSTEASAIEITATINVEDETDAELGEIVAKVKGESDFAPNELVVGTYGDYEVEVSAADPETVYAGNTEQEIANITIKEILEGSLVNDRTLTLTLPDWAKWGALPSSVSDGSVTLTLDSFPGKDGQVAKYEISNPSANNDAELELEDMEVVLSPDAPEGDLVVEVSGSASVDAEVTVANVVKPVTVEATEAPTIVIGRSGQSIGEVTITEAADGVIKDGKDLILSLPDDVEWDDYDVEVVEGDLELGDIDDSDSDLTIEIDDASNEASTIKITGTVVAYRTVPEGEVPVKVKGDALIEVNDVDGRTGAGPVDDQYGDVPTNGNYYQIEGFDAVEYDEDGLFEDDTTVAKVTVATVGTPAPEEKAMSTSITLGDNGSYISNGRIMVQLRDAANALGVANQNIFWDNATKTATFIKGDRVAQITVGDPQVKLNGVALPTDQGAEIKDGKTYVSLSAAGVALNAVTAWDNTTKTATLTTK